MHAHSIQPATAAEDRSTEFTAVDGNGEHYSGTTLLVEAYAALWLILMLWLALLWRKQVALTSRIAGLEGAIARAERKDAGTAAETAAGKGSRTAKGLEKGA